jgi:hypothetical protein
MSAYKGQVSIKFGNLTYTTQSLNDGTLVKVGAGMTFDIKAKGYSVSYADQCLTIEENSVHVPLCLDELKQLVASNLPPALGAIFQRLMSSSPAVGFVTVQENGHWFVSPTRSYLQDMVGLLALFKAQDLQTIATNVSSLENAYQKMLQKEMQSLGAGSAASMPSIPLPGL